MRKRQWNCFMKCWSSDSFYGLHLLYTSADRFFFSLFVISNPLLENYIILLLCSLFSWVLSGFHLVLKVLVIFWVTVTRSQIKLSLNIPYFRSSKIISTNQRIFIKLFKVLKQLLRTIAVNLFVMAVTFLAK